MKQKRIRRSKIFRICIHLPEFRNVWETIQKGSFAYNTLFLGMDPLKRSFSCTDLADITTLALFFGDEFIDGIRLSSGDDFIMTLLNNEAERFYLQKKVNGSCVRLQYSFNLLKLLPQNILNEINPKYKISYKKFYSLLKCFLHEMNTHLAKLSFEKAQVVADKITDACNTCLDSYLHDITSYPVQDCNSDIPMLLEYHELKTRYMQYKLLEIRCALAEKEDGMHSIQLQGWINIGRVMQIYDDMQDIAVDDGFQDNLLLGISRSYFPNEWEWFCANKHLLNDKRLAALLTSLNMPASVQLCLQMAADKIRVMNWEQQKIIHCLLKNNWFIARRDKEMGSLGKNELKAIYGHIKSSMQHLPEKMIKSYAVDVCLHKRSARKYLLRNVNFTLIYQLKYDLLLITPEVKAGIFDKITN